MTLFLLVCGHVSLSTTRVAWEALYVPRFDDKRPVRATCTHEILLNTVRMASADEFYMMGKVKTELVYRISDRSGLVYSLLLRWGSQIVSPAVNPGTIVGQNRNLRGQASTFQWFLTWRDRVTILST